MNKSDPMSIALVSFAALVVSGAIMVLCARIYRKLSSVLAHSQRALELHDNKDTVSSSEKKWLLEHKKKVALQSYLDSFKTEAATEIPNTNEGQAVLSTRVELKRPCMERNGLAENNQQSHHQKPLSLPFHTHLFEDVNFFQQALFCTWVVLFGPIVLLFRAIFVFLTFSIGGADVVKQPWFFQVLGFCFVVKNKEEHARAKFDQDGNKRKVVFLANHHITYDTALINAAVQRTFGLSAKLMVNKKVYYSPFTRSLGAAKFFETFTITSENGGASFLDIFKEWAAVSPYSSSTSFQKHPSDDPQALTIAPSGMTTHLNMVTPMYWEYFANPQVAKVMVNVDVTNPFGVKLRNLSSSSLVTEALSFMIPWLTCYITFHTDVVPEGDDTLQSQAQVDDLVRRIYTNQHGKHFAPGWNQKRRRKIDKFLQKGEFVHANLKARRKNDRQPQEGLPSLGSSTVKDDDQMPSNESSLLLSNVTTNSQNTTKIHITDRLINNICTANSSPNEIALINPISMKDEVIAAAFDIPMIKTKYGRFNEMEANINALLQRNFDFFVMNIIGTALHHITMERNLIVLATLLVSSGLWTKQILLLAQMIALVPFPLLILKVIINRPRPVCLSTTSPVRSLIGSIQTDGSFPSIHTASFVTLTVVILYEGLEVFALSIQILFIVLTALTAFEQVRLGAHYVTDVLASILYVGGFVSLFYEAGGKELLLENTSHADLSFQIRLSCALALGQLFTAIIAFYSFRPLPSPLSQKSYLENNIARIADEKNKLQKGEESKEVHHSDTDLPAGRSLDFFAPFIAVSATAFWVMPLIDAIYLRSGDIPETNISGLVRFCGVLASFSFIVLVILPIRRWSAHHLGNLMRLLGLTLVNMAMLVFAALYSHFLIQSVQSLVLNN